jgi:UDP-2,3-diacylglucosamine hydrolase
MPRAYFISDAHLKSMREANAGKLLAFLRAISPRPGAKAHPLAATHLFLVGDIFDLWVGSHRWFIDEYAPLADATRALVEGGVEIHFFEGNHDIYLTDFWQGKVGAAVHRDAAVFRLGETRARVEHGDLINPADGGYLALRKALRSRPVEWLAKRLPDRAIAAIGRYASAASRAYGSDAKKADAEAIRAMIRAHARRVSGPNSANATASASGDGEFDLIVTGHAHVRDDWSFQAFGRPARAVNLGWWRHDQQAFVVDGAGQRFVAIDDIIAAGRAERARPQGS